MDEYQTGKYNYSRIYADYFPLLVRFAKEYVISLEDAQNLVQDLFLYLWEHQELLSSISNINAFLFTLIKNRCIDFYRHRVSIEGRNEPLDSIHERELSLKMYALQRFDENLFAEEDIEVVLMKAIQQLPEKCREVFVLSRIEGLKHQEIALRLGISPNTVQNHIVTALRKLKIELKDYLPLFLFLS